MAVITAHQAKFSFKDGRSGLSTQFLTMREE
ncbi:uncharacterized protein G2W53_042148 [Senna tora]|uniref:Uncharacterized protein n=1 Tax=Senna tora TaxID=362788 RepID=A0A834SGJ8_9FABA|nr:uncharacterized protein G2W53_042148 [Senna tora]